MKIWRCNDGNGSPLGWGFECPGCGDSHVVYTENVPHRPNWGFNGSVDKPTFTPSILVRGTKPLTDAEIDRVCGGEKIDPIPRVCHSFVADGRIQFLGDCTHALAGQTVDLPDVV